MYDVHRTFVASMPLPAGWSPTGATVLSAQLDDLIMPEARAETSPTQTRRRSIHTTNHPPSLSHHHVPKRSLSRARGLVYDCCQHAYSTNYCRHSNTAASMLVATMPQTQYLQVPKALPGRRSRSRSRTSRTREPSPVEVYSPDRVVVSPMKLSFSSVPIRSPSPDRQSFKPEPYRKPSFTNGHYNKMATTSWSEKPRRIASCPVPSLELEDAPMTGTNYDDLNEGLYTMEQCVTPPPEPPLKERLVGAWKLESYIAYPTPVSPVQRPTFPMTKNVTGFIMYTPDGYMSAQMLIPGQQSFKRGEGEEPQWAEAGKRCFAYCGPYYISNEGLGREEILRHTFQCCSLPGWIGDIQIRTHRFEEDGQVLVLGSEEPTEVKGDKRIPVLKWRRARDNSNGVPPPPTPQIKVSGPGEP